MGDDGCNQSQTDSSGADIGPSASSRAKLSETAAAWAPAAASSAAIAAVVLSLFTYSATNSSTTQQYNLSRNGQIADRFSKAVELLTAGETGKRLGGIYALQQIAEESPSYRDTVKNELSGFIRVNTHRQGPDCGPSADVTKSPDLSAATSILADKPPVDDSALAHADGKKDSRWKNDAKSFIDLSGSCLRGISMERSRLEYIHLNGADIGDSAFDDANLTHASLGASGSNVMNDGSEYVAYLHSIGSGSLNIFGSSFRNAILDGADLSSIVINRPCDASRRTVWFHKARLKGAVMWQSVIPDADFTGAVMDDMKIAASAFVGGKFDSTTSFRNVTIDQWIDLEQADLRGADLRGIRFVNPRKGQSWPKINFRNANLYGADLRNVDLADADFSGADLREAKFDGLDQLKESRWDGWTLWPEDFHPATAPVIIAAQPAPPKPAPVPKAPAGHKPIPVVPTQPPVNDPQVTINHRPDGSVRIDVGPSDSASTSGVSRK